MICAHMYLAASSGVQVLVLYSFFDLYDRVQSTVMFIIDSES